MIRKWQTIEIVNVPLILSDYGRITRHIANAWGHRNSLTLKEVTRDIKIMANNAGYTTTKMVSTNGKI